MVLLNLFFVFFRISLLAIGGAYSFLPLIEREVVDRQCWLTKTEFLDVLGMVKVFPGAISIKYSTYTGYKVAGLPGALVANIGNLLAPFVLIMLASLFYHKYQNNTSVKSSFKVIQLVTFAMMIAMAFHLIPVNDLMQVRNIVIIVVAFVLFLYTKVHPALLIIGAGILGYCFPG